MDKKIIIAGVGGQGTLLASKIISDIAIRNDFDVKTSEVHGMAQRGGSVVNFIKFGEKIHSSIIEKGEADILIAFEELEALRWSEYVKDGGTIICNTYKIKTSNMMQGKDEYPTNTTDILNKYYDVHKIDAHSIAKQLGDLRVVNVIMLGVLSKFLEIDRAKAHLSITNLVKQRFVDINIKAFEQGYTWS